LRQVRVHLDVDCGEIVGMQSKAYATALACLQPLNFGESFIYKLLRAYNDGIRVRLAARVRSLVTTLNKLKL
jgi:hypothetical protein